MKIPINFDEMYDAQLLALGRKCIKELNDRGLEQFKIVKR